MVPQMVKNPPAIRETWVQSLDWEDLLEEGMATHPSILAWRIPMHRRAWQALSMGLQRIRHDWAAKYIIFQIILKSYCGQAAKKQCKYRSAETIYKFSIRLSQKCSSLNTWCIWKILEKFENCTYFIGRISGLFDAIINYEYSI